MNKEIFNRRISLFGATENVLKAESILLKLPSLETDPEDLSRLVIMDLIDEHNLKCSILYCGNTVWNRKKLLKDVKSVVKNGMESMTDYLYKFLSLSCGSIAHFDRRGWIATYPTVGHLKAFFRMNEMGQSVYDYQPRWKTDAKTIVKEIEKILKI